MCFCLTDHIFWFKLITSSVSWPVIADIGSILIKNQEIKIPFWCFFFSCLKETQVYSSTLATHNIFTEKVSMFLERPGNIVLCL